MSWCAYRLCFGDLKTKSICNKSNQQAIIRLIIKSGVCEVSVYSALNCY